MGRVAELGSLGRSTRMNLPTILAIAVLASVAANALHWRGRSGERFLYYPQSGRLRLIFAAWTIGAVVMAILSLAGFIPSPAFLGVALGLTIGHELYSIARRQHQRARA